MRALIKVKDLKNSPGIKTYHPHYLPAVLSSEITTTRNFPQHESDGESSNEEWSIPAIEFTTEEWTRRSMTLNGMRMSTEFLAHDSPRVLQLVEQRLQEKQGDVVHDVLVYLWERILQIRADMDEARTLQAESLAAYLGLQPTPIIELFLSPELSIPEIVRQINSGVAGPPRRALHVAPLLENLLARLRPELEELQSQENRIRQLINEIVTRLYEDSH